MTTLRKKNIRDWIVRNERFLTNNRDVFPQQNLTDALNMDFRNNENKKNVKKLFKKYKDALLTLRKNITKNKREDLKKSAINLGFEGRINTKTTKKALQDYIEQRERQQFIFPDDLNPQEVKVNDEDIKDYVSVKSGLRGMLSKHKIDGFGYTDLDLYLNDMLQTYNAILKKRLSSYLPKTRGTNLLMRGIKFKIIVNLELEKPSLLFPDARNDRFNQYIMSSQTTIYNENEIIPKLLENFTVIRQRFDEFVFKSNLRLIKVNYSELNSGVFTPIQGGRYINLPDVINNKKACINIQNKDDRCFEYAVLCHFHHKEIKKDPQRPSKYKEWFGKNEEIKLTNIETPVRLSDLPKIEKLNPDLAFNIFTYDYFEGFNKFFLNCAYRTEDNSRKNRINLLLATEEDEDTIYYHYVYIKNLNALFHKKNFKCSNICDNCLVGFNSKERLEKHIQDGYCFEHGFIKTQLPKKNCNDTIEFFKHSSFLPAPYTIFVDFECSLIDVDVDAVDTQEGEKTTPFVRKTNKTQKISKHIPNSFGLKVVCNYNPNFSKPYQYYNQQSSNDDISKKLISILQEETRAIKEEVSNTNKPMIISKEQQKEFEKSTKCWICDKSYTKNDIKVRDHDHITGKYRGSAHNKCNLELNYDDWDVPVIFHNFKGYDSHFIIKSLPNNLDNIFCIPNNKEKIMNLRFNDVNIIDSFNFLSTSLEVLSNNILNSSYRILKDGVPDEEVDNIYKRVLKGDIDEKHTEIINTYLNATINNFPILKSDFPNTPPKDLILLLRKGVYPYEWMNNLEKFNEKSLPPISSFYSSLKNETITEEEYQHAQNVWKTFKCSTFRDYHNLYLKIDVLLLSDIWFNFRKLCLEKDNLEPSNYVSLPSYSWDNSLLFKRKQKINYEFKSITEEYADIYFLIEKHIRGGISTISKRYSRANNKYMSDYDPSKKSSYIRYFDANNLYGHAMSQRLPVSDFKYDESEWNEEKIQGIDKDASTGYFFLVDLEYPQHLHKSHNDYPLAPENLLIQEEMLSNYSTSFLLKHNQKHLDTKKLVPNLMDKKEYLTHYRNLQLYLQLGLKLKKIHQVISFRQEYLLKDYINYNTTERKKAKNDFEKDFFKLKNNSVYGKTMENVRNRIDYKFVVSNERKMNKLLLRPNFEDTTIISEDIIGVLMKKTSVKLDKPIFVGFAVLELSKLLMYDFHYNVMKKKFKDNINLLMTDTDSLVYEIFTDDIYEDLKDIEDYFDNSEHTVINNPKNKKELGKFKDETDGKEIKEFIGLRSKMYSIKMDEDEEKKKAKGIPKSIVKHKISHSNYKECIDNFTFKTEDIYSIKSHNHEVYTEVMNKIGLSPYDDKRYVLDDGVNTNAYGFKRLFEEKLGEPLRGSFKEQ